MQLISMELYSTWIKQLMNLLILLKAWLSQMFKAILIKLLSALKEIWVVIFQYNFMIMRLLVETKTSSAGKIGVILLVILLILLNQ